jgi:hypothetical protein
MKKTMTFKNVKFSPEAISEAREYLNKLITDQDRKHMKINLEVNMLDGESWSHENEAEFFSDYRKDHDYSEYCIFASQYYIRIDWISWDRQ